MAVEYFSSFPFEVRFMGEREIFNHYFFE